MGRNNVTALSSISTDDCNTIIVAGSIAIVILGYYLYRHRSATPPVVTTFTPSPASPSSLTTVSPSPIPPTPALQSCTTTASSTPTSLPSPSVVSTTSTTLLPSPQPIAMPPPLPTPTPTQLPEITASSTVTAASTMTTTFNACLKNPTWIREHWRLLLLPQIQQQWLEKRVSRSPSHLVLTTEQQVVVQQAFTSLQQNQKTFITEVGQGIEHFCFRINGVPGIIFKRSCLNWHRNENNGYRNESDVRSRCAVYETAAKICERSNLYFLQVPQCHYIKSDSGEYFLMQEELILLPASAYEHVFKGLSQEECLLDLYNQLILFITASNYMDASLGNMPFTPSGRIALIDLDDTRAVTDHLNGWVQRMHPEFLTKRESRHLA